MTPRHERLALPPGVFHVLYTDGNALWPRPFRWQRQSHSYGKATATFGLSNPGTKGIVRDKPLVIPPHVATMTCGAIEERPVAVQGRVEIRPMMTLGFTFGPSRTTLPRQA